MVLRKQPPPRLDNISKWNARPESHSPSPTAKSAASSPRCARTTRIPSQESVYSPDLNTSPAFDLMPLEEAQRSPVGSTTSYPPHTWAEHLGGRAEHHRPDTVEGTDRADTDHRGDWIPPALVPGSHGMAEHGSQPVAGSHNATTGDVPVQLQSNNPFLKQRPAQPNRDSSDPTEWNGRHSHTTINSDLLSQTEGYIPMTARLSLVDPDHESSWAYAENPHVETHHSLEHDPSPWASEHSIKISAPQEIYVQGEHNNPYAPAVIIQPSDQPDEDPFGLQPSQNHGRLGSDAGIHTPSAMSSAISSGTSATSHELIDLEPPDTLGVETGSHRAASSVYSSEAVGPTTEWALSDGFMPPTESPSVLQSNDDTRDLPQPTSGVQLSTAGAARQKEQRAETYSIRHINWTDPTGNLLKSPILVQNENGPCPLLALINALALRADPKEETPIVKALRTREQISLGLLIEALFEELTTCLSPDEEFPDIEALTQFLTMLHTGMNVNPRLTLETVDSLGTFFQTADLRLYSTFGVPLIHGWLAPWSSQAHTAMTRVAQYHEDIQLLPFRKQELEDCIMRGGSLSPEEEQKMADIQVIEEFVDVENATQLSPFGLTQLSTKLAPGSISIFFRNDHFSTLYKHPRSQQLYSLVTDTGYAKYAEIVWESLVDMTGFNSEFFSGDFRAVGHGSSGSADSAAPRVSSGTAANAPPAAGETLRTSLSSQEQSDADYAFALSLQYEEEHREQSGNQQAPNRVSSTPLRSPPGSSPRMSNAPTRSSSIANGLISQTSPQPHQHPDPDDPNAPPPPYEQAASGPRYSPPDRRSHYGEASTHQYNQYPGNRYPRNRYSARPVNTDRFSDRRNSNKDCILM
ncbi:uncharacterized protein N7459_010086 [Penicillium hispanicum]|uniref:uncharacterized protein n=1 Tax=Penicillium hispanicum TaxID=1080232 RepID=UPI00253F7922|nr:uncharacterized protein N7459_010086 [Penicillium hispanicum]KAJ5566704.1 hypothetical protein N7459_010086 [Penicillium hispanicum]